MAKKARRASKVKPKFGTKLWEKRFGSPKVRRAKQGAKGQK